MTPPTNAGGTDLISHFALAANGNVSAPKPNKSATDSMNRPHFITPRSKVVGMFAVDYEGLRAADKSCEAPPSLSQAVYRQPCLLLFDFAGDPVPPKEPPSLRWEAPPPKHLSTFVSEPDPINLPFCLFSRVELEQCSCQQLLVENCRAPFADLAV